MGRLLGSHDGGDSLDRPDLNRCPDCGCYFESEECPLCGKICPEDMRAGNRKEVKQKKITYSRASSRVTFVEWYHSWWFIILMLFVWPLVGIVLLATSPHQKRWKLTVIVIAVIYTIFSTYGFGTVILQRLNNMRDKPINTSMDRTEYIEACESVDAEVFFRTPDRYNDGYVATTLVVQRRLIDSEGYYNNGSYYVYYLCKDTDNDAVTVLIRNCLQDEDINYVEGDIITVYGEGVGNKTITDMEYQSHTAPCIHVAYAVVDGGASSGNEE